MATGTGVATTLGYSTPALSFGDQKTIPIVARGFAGLTGYVPFEEIHHDTLEITDHPIEQGGNITDHAFRRPAKLTLKIGWSNSTVGGNSGSSYIGSSAQQVAEIYQQLLLLQAQRDPFEVMTGKRLYQNMLLQELQVQTDSKSEHVLMVTATFREIILVSTSTILVEKVPAASQASAATTQSTTNTGTKQMSESTTVNEAAAMQSINPE